MKQLKNGIVSRAFIAISIAIFFSACRKPIEHCHQVNATGTGNIVSQTETGATTASEITGSGLNGTTIAHLVFTGADPATGNLLFGGDLVLTTSYGTLTFEAANGILTPATGEFSNDANIISGTGACNGASGSLYFHGFIYPDGSFVDDKICGEICKDGHRISK